MNTRILITEATNKGSGETAHKRSLARAFVVRRDVVLSLESSGHMSIAKFKDCACVIKES